MTTSTISTADYPKLGKEFTSIFRIPGFPTKDVLLAEIEAYTDTHYGDEDSHQDLELDCIEFSGFAVNASVSFEVSHNCYGDGRNTPNEYETEVELYDVTITYVSHRDSGFEQEFDQFIAL